MQTVQRALLLTVSVLLHHQPGGQGQLAYLAQTHAPPDTAITRPPPQGLEAAVEQQDALAVVEQHEGIGNALDGVDQVLVRSFGLAARLAQQLVAGLQFDQRAVERIGTLAHLLGQHHRMLEGGIGIGTVRPGRLHPFDQGGIDALQTVIARLQRVNTGLQLSGTGFGRGDRWRHR